jgi:hypothetical protein
MTELGRHHFQLLDVDRRIVGDQYLQTKQPTRVRPY